MLILLAAALLAGCSGYGPPPSLKALEERSASGDATAYDGLVSYMAKEKRQDERSRAYIALLKAGQNAAPTILTAASEGDPTQREHAIALAANLKLKGGFEVAMKALNDPSFPRRHSAAWALGELGDARAIEPLADTVESSDRELTAREAARALARFGKAAVLPLAARLEKMPNKRKGYALRVLGELRDERGKPYLIKALEDPHTREDALWALGTMGRIGKPSDTAFYLDDQDWRVRVEAARATGLLQENAAKVKLDYLRAEDPVKAVREWSARAMSLLEGNPVEYKTFSGEWKIPDSLYH